MGVTRDRVVLHGEQQRSLLRFWSGKLAGTVKNDVTEQHEHKQTCECYKFAHVFTRGDMKCMDK